MPRTKDKKKTTDGGQRGAQALPPLDPLRPGMPAPDSITGVKEVERDGQVFRIIKTNETDAYDEPAAQDSPRRKRKPKG